MKKSEAYAFVTLLTLTYLAGSLITLSFNPFLWSIEARLTFIFVEIIWIVVASTKID